MGSGSRAGKAPRRDWAEAGRSKAHGRPFLESPSLVVWGVVVSVFAVHVVWLLMRFEYWVSALLYIGLLSLATFLVFGLDKWRARRGGRRVSEVNLVAISICGGAAGALLGMALFRHKVNSLKIRIAAAVGLFLHVAGVLVLGFSTGF